jgi:hypothetical protein
VTVEVLPYWGELTVELDGAPVSTNRLRRAAWCRHGQGTGRHGDDLRADPSARAVRARTARTSMKSGTDVLGTAPPFKISPKPRCIPY